MSSSNCRQMCYAGCCKGNNNMRAPKNTHFTFMEQDRAEDA